jgi:Mo-dependent nitrogenase C-terminus
MPNLQMASTLSSLSLSAVSSTVPTAPAKTVAVSSSVSTSVNASPISQPKTFRWPRAVEQFCQPIQAWLDAVEVRDADAARLLQKIIPGQCPFERDVNLFGRTILHIPPLCKLNPFYEQLVALRFRALCYLADECGESNY